MKLENQVVCRELSEKIEKLGVKQESLFYWINYYGGSNKPLWEVVWHERNRSGLSAFTLAELGEMLPWNYCSGKCSPKCDKGKYWCQDWNEENEIQYADTEANARAKMKIWLIEKKNKEKL